MAWEEHDAGRPQVNLVSAYLLSIVEDTQDPVTDVDRSPVRIDVTQSDHPVGARGRATAVEHGADPASDFQLRLDRFGRECEHIGTSFYLALDRKSVV